MPFNTGQGGNLVVPGMKTVRKVPADYVGPRRKSPGSADADAKVARGRATKAPMMLVKKMKKGCKAMS